MGNAISFLRLKGWHAPAGRRTCEPRPLVQDGQIRSAPPVGARKTGARPTDRFARQPDAASADSEVRPGPRLQTLRPYQAKTSEAGPEAQSTSSLPTRCSWLRSAWRSRDRAEFLFAGHIGPPPGHPHDEVHLGCALSDDHAGLTADLQAELDGSFIRRHRSQGMNYLLQGRLQLVERIIKRHPSAIRDHARSGRRQNEIIRYLGAIYFEHQHIFAIGNTEQIHQAFLLSYNLAPAT